MSNADGFIKAPVNRPIHVANSDCPYCGVEFSDAVPWDKEHTIARGFVPKGTLQAQWNLLLRSCGPCNAVKGNLEDDISAITMHPDAAGRFVNDDPRLREEAVRKAQRSISRRTKKLVSAGEEPLKVETSFGAAKLTFGFTMPPQADEDRIFELAEYHVRGFFYWITFNSETKRGARIPGQFFPVAAVRKADWGNPQLKWFMQETKDWLGRVHAIGADGYFAISLRRKAEDINLWSWALEWNQNFRVVGFFGAPHRLDEIEKLVPTLEFTTVPTGGANFISYRADTQLAENEDTLFDLPAGFVLPPSPDTI